MNEKGMSLVELMIAIAMSGIASAAIYLNYNSHHKSYVAQEQVADMQQNLRVAVYYMEKEIKMAGCNPTGITGASAPGIITANWNTIRFTTDVRGAAAGSDSDGDVNDPSEDITFSLCDADGNGINDLCRRDPNDGLGGNTLVLASNFDGIDFVYLDEQASVLNDVSSRNVLSADIGKIRSVQITLVAKAEKRQSDYTNNKQYANQQGDLIVAAQNDNFRRRGLTTNIKCRNLGL